MSDELEFIEAVERLRDEIMGELHAFDNEWQVPLVITITPSSFIGQGGKTRTVYPVTITRPLEDVK